MTPIFETPTIPIHDQAALVWGAIGHLEKRGLILQSALIGGVSKPVIYVENNQAARALKGAESHITQRRSNGDTVVMVTEYRGCQVEWIQPRGLSRASH